MTGPLLPLLPLHRFRTADRCVTAVRWRQALSCSSTASASSLNTWKRPRDHAVVSGCLRPREIFLEPECIRSRQGIAVHNDVRIRIVVYRILSSSFEEKPHVQTRFTSHRYEISTQRTTQWRRFFIQYSINNIEGIQTILCQTRQLFPISLHRFWVSFVLNLDYSMFKQLMTNIIQNLSVKCLSFAQPYKVLDNYSCTLTMWSLTCKLPVLTHFVKCMHLLVKF